VSENSEIDSWFEEERKRRCCWEWRRERESL